MRALTAALIVLVALAGTMALAPAAGAQEEPYNDSDGNVTHGNWTENRTTVDMENTTHYISRIGTFVVGDDPNDPGAGPLLTGLLVAGIAVSMLGTSRTGLVASGTMGVVVVAGLSASVGVGLLPRWLYAVVILLFAFVGAVLYLRMVE